MDLLIKNGRVIDPANNIDDKLDILVRESKIERVAPNIYKEGAAIIDASNKLVVPGLIDVHVHFREPGRHAYKETIKSGARAAAKGGFTTVICQPNTVPRIESTAHIKAMLDCAKKESIVNIHPSSCITKGSYHKELVNFKEVKEAGAVKITDDGDPVLYKELIYEALREAKKVSIPVSLHCELSGWAEHTLKELKNPDTILGFKLSPYKYYKVEAAFVKRDIELARKADWPIHIEHVTLRASIGEIKKAKAQGFQVTAEATPHHFTLTEEDEKKYGTNAKINPPLREMKDVEALRKGLADGTIDIIASDHAPHTLEDKNVGWDDAPYGVIGLETTLGLVLTQLVDKKVISLYDAIAKLTTNPAKNFGLNAGALNVGMPADITVIDLERKWIVDADKFESMARNCPFHGWKLKGKALTTIVNGKIVMQNERIIC
jgi:dihydroorotase